MQIQIRKATIRDSQFCFECVRLLIDKEMYTFEKFKQYFESVIESPICDVWVACAESSDVGLIIANKFYIPRYLGYGYDLEEIVILPDFQNKGLGSSFISAVIDHYSKDADCRKVIIKSNDANGSCRLYASLIDTTDLIVFQKYLNKL